MSSGSEFPAGLLDWAGHRGGGVRRLFSPVSGRPTGVVIQTPLLSRLQIWAEAIGRFEAKTPRVVLLVGGPGNGKTEAVEFAINELDKALGLSGSLIRDLESRFLARDGEPTPRLAPVELSALSLGRLSGRVLIVQDASASDPNRQTETPASLLVEDLESLAAPDSSDIFLACVNRGVLDDALIVATDGARAKAQGVLEAIVRSVGMGPEPVACWPLRDYPSTAVWPMDVESLVGNAGARGDHPSPGTQLLSIATEPDRWPSSDACPAGQRCPFCSSRTQLAGEPHGTSFLKVLRWYELASGKRLTFRDLFSLYSYLLSGLPREESRAAGYEPCEWAARMVELSDRTAGKEALRYQAPFLLVAAQYQHALFGRWPRLSYRGLRMELAELGVQENPTLLGFAQFVGSNRYVSMPQTLGAQLASLSELLDPGVASPDIKASVSSQTTITFRDLDVRFSQSVAEGLQFIQKYRCLTASEVDLLKRLAAADQRLSEPEISRRRPAVAAKIQALMRDFSCRLVRRSIGARTAAVRDAESLLDFENVVSGDVQLLHDSARRVESLLNVGDRFVISLNTTFGQPLPPLQRQAVLTTAKQKVKPRDQPEVERPPSAVRFLTVGGGTKGQSIPLTYELFKSVRELSKGMMPASLPRTVVALLDTTRARLAGQVVRDEELLDGSEIQIGLRDEVIVRELNEFLVRRKETP